MPTTCGHKDSKGYFCRWGGHGAHYYYTPGDEASKKEAKKKANAQGAAAHANGYEGSLEKEIPKRSGNSDDRRKKPGGGNRDTSPEGGRDTPSGGMPSQTTNPGFISQSFEGSSNKVPNPDEPGDEPIDPTEEWKKSIDTPTKMEDIKEGSFILYKGKIGKILKVLEK